MLLTTLHPQAFRLFVHLLRLDVFLSNALDEVFRVFEGFVDHDAIRSTIITKHIKRIVSDGFDEEETGAKEKRIEKRT